MMSHTDIFVKLDILHWAFIPYCVKLIPGHSARLKSSNSNWMAFKAEDICYLGRHRRLLLSFLL